MEFLKHLKTIVFKPSILMPHKRIFLLSHMRANTSLFGHILGSHPEVEGYYELHIGYYSWKSFIRQKLIYFAQHDKKSSANYIFDKVLHNEHYVEPKLLSNSNSVIIFSLREPIQTIKSIIALYQKNDPNHSFAQVDGASKYYIGRLKQLEKLSKQLECKVIYIDAQCLRDNTEDSLTFLTKEIGLKQPLTSEYETQNLTGTNGAGDRSDNLKLGKIKAGKTDYSSIELDESIKAELIEAYNKTRSALIKGSISAHCSD